jgi:hypothetical protein
VHPEHFEAFAAIGPIQSASVAAPTTDVRLDGAATAGLYLFLVRRCADHFDTQLVAEDPWICEKWLTSREGVQIGSAHADAMHADKGFSWTGFHRGGDLFPKLSRLLEYDLAHQFDSISFPSSLLSANMS